MTTAVHGTPEPWSDAVMAAALVAIDPAGLGGVCVRSAASPVRDAWLKRLRASLAPAAPFRRIPLAIADDRLLGGLDLAATLSRGQPVVAKGVLAEADGGVVVLPSAERLASATVARLVAVLDHGEVALERDGLARRFKTRFGVIALDEGETDDERAPPAVRDRLAFHIDLTNISLLNISHGALDGDRCDLPHDLAAIQDQLPHIVATGDIVDAICQAAMALGIVSLRAPMLALRTARAAAALAGREAMSEADVVLAARLVLGPRATCLPPADDQTEPDQAEPPPPETSEDLADDQAARHDGPLLDTVMEAAQAAIPAGLLALLRSGQTSRRNAAATGRAGASRQAPHRGRPIGARRGELRSGARLNLIETLRAAAPWQRVRQRARAGRRVEVRRDDFRITRFKINSETTTIFVVDASGSAALLRLAVAKVAVELLLADCYVRRDRVALIAFRGGTAELLLPPTRSLVRAKRLLAGLPGGGGTPLAAGLDAGLLLAEIERRKGTTPAIVVLTDGRANVARDPAAGRSQAADDSQQAARAVRAAGYRALVVDTSPRPGPAAAGLAAEMGAIYVPLPYADAAVISQAIRSGLA